MATTAAARSMTKMNDGETAYVELTSGATFVNGGGNAVF